MSVRTPIKSSVGKSKRPRLNLTQPIIEEPLLAEDDSAARNNTASSSNGAAASSVLPAEDRIEDPDSIPNEEEMVRMAEEAEQQHALTLHRNGPVSPVSKAGLAVFKADMVSTIRQHAEQYYNTNIPFKPTQSLFRWYGSENDYWVHCLTLKPDNIRVYAYEKSAEKMQQLQATYGSNFKKQREVYIRPKVTQSGHKSDQMFAFTYLYPHMKVALSKMHDLGNHDDTSEFAPKDKEHDIKRGVMLTEEAFEETMKDEEDRNALAVRALDWKEQLQEAFYQAVKADPKICTNIKEGVMKEVPRERKNDPEVYGKMTDAQIADRLLRKKMRQFVKPPKEKYRSFFVQDNVFKHDKNKPADYQAPTQALQELLDRFASSDYLHYQKGLLKDMVVKEIPVYVPKTKEEIDADYLRYGEYEKEVGKLKARETVEMQWKRPYKRVSFAESCKIVVGDLVAPMVNIAVTEEHQGMFSLKENLVALFWTGGASTIAAEELLAAQPFYVS